MMSAVILPHFTEMARFRLPHTAKGWVILIVLVALLLGVDFLLEKFFPNLSKQIRRIIEAVLLVIIFLISGIDSETLYG